MIKNGLESWKQVEMGKKTWEASILEIWLDVKKNEGGGESKVTVMFKA